MIANKVKLVVWDLDETFWQGTLSEEGIVPIARNSEIVRELSTRGIINSISSKNDYQQTKAKLIELNIWDYFVFPSISFGPKGKAVSELIEAAALRAENVLFLDDNPMNLEEVKFFNPGIMTSHPKDALEGLLDHPNLKGKPDPELTRLKQYRFLQDKFETRSASTLSNEEFLRESNIRIQIDHDIDANLERVVELINRTNQLNYTKQRLETPETLAEFREQLNAFGYYAGCVRAVDKYGDYGLIGFFLMQRRAKFKRLVHFAFSCRTMNMGIEQYIYEMLGKPDIEIAEPVSYGLETHAAIDWIRTGDQSSGPANGNDKPLLLVGGCDLMQVANYCSSNRIEFVNTVQNDIMVRYDDPGFIAGDREAIRESKSIRKIPCWTYEDTVRFDAALATSQLILISMWTAMSGKYLMADGNVLLRQGKERLNKIKADNPKVFRKRFEEMSYSPSQKLDLVERSYDWVRDRIRSDCHVFVLGVHEVEQGAEGKKAMFNAHARAYCERYPGRFHFVDLSPIITPDKMEDARHFSREGYFALARHILSLAEAQPELLRQVS
ncbi:MAG TPA: HAD-IIIC family phosphatase [Rhizomicrobium sp.]|nr:HAD-IIIC family phosphatase [Rhizomicrobium sp.]